MTVASGNPGRTKATISVLALCILLLNPVLSRGQGVHVEGRVFTEKGPMQGATVSVYKTYLEISAGTPSMTSSPTDGQGRYALILEEGEYYFTAKGTVQGRTFFAYHGSNPIRVGTKNIWLGLMANEAIPPVYASGPESVHGTVTYKGKPVKGAHIAFYSLEGKEFKGLGFLAGKKSVFITEAGDDGTFTFALPPDEYVVIARKIQNENKVMPLRAGDLYCYAAPNPIEVRAQMTVRVDLPCYPKGDRLSFVASPKIKTNDYLTVEDLKASGQSGIKGKVIDAEGKPLPGIYVIAYKVVSTKLNHETENITVTDAEGNYFLHLDSSGSYGLVARETLGAAPHPEELTGLHRDNPWEGISLQSGQIIESMNITLKKAPTVDYEPQNNATPLGIKKK